MGIKVWAAIAETLKDYTGICEDPDAVKKTGWDEMIQFQDFDDLVEQLWPESPTNQQRRNRPAAPATEDDGKKKPHLFPAIEPGGIDELAICAHGHWAGILCYYGVDGLKAGKGLALKTLAKHHEKLHRIGLATTENAKIILASCVVGYQDLGLELVKRLSQIWRGRTVVTFNAYLEHNAQDHGVTSAAVAGWSQRQCALPGANSGVNWSQAGIDETTGLERWAGFQPPAHAFGSLGTETADEKSPYAWVFKNGNVVTRASKSIGVPEFIVKDMVKLPAGALNGTELLRQFCAQSDKHTNDPNLLGQCGAAPPRQGGLNGRSNVNRGTRVGSSRN